MLLAFWHPEQRKKVRDVPTTSLSGHLMRSHPIGVIPQTSAVARSSSSRMTCSSKLRARPSTSHWAAARATVCKPGKTRTRSLRAPSIVAQSFFRQSLNVRSSSQALASTSQNAARLSKVGCQRTDLRATNVQLTLKLGVGKPRRGSRPYIEEVVLFN